ncbi:MAG: hypothetical protein LUH49_07075, partial [Cloacibacillus porcorum]|uniref:hypothetical protein n=1 Tax=Cloacibacillus porcorum TaxID=1197717 RepID=UPI0023F4336D
IIIQGLYLDVRFSGCCSEKGGCKGKVKRKVKPLFIFYPIKAKSLFIIDPIEDKSARINADLRRITGR